MCSRKADTVDAETQTVIRVFPFMLDEHTNAAQVSADKKLQTMTSITPDQQSDKFYSLLRFTPYRDIQENSLKVVDLPRKVRLQFTPAICADNAEKSAQMFTLADDDGVGYICADIIHRSTNPHKNCYVDDAVQTDLKVHPHLLQDEQIAGVYNDSQVQTSK